MNNEVLEKIEEYNNGGLLNWPLTFNNNADATALLNAFKASICSGFGPLPIPKDKTIELSVVQAVDTLQVHNDPAGIENYIRDELAQKLAKQLIEEDLIQIQSCEDIERMNTIFQAKIKVVQE